MSNLNHEPAGSPIGGRFAHNTGTAGTMQGMLAQVAQPDGGFTYDPVSKRSPTEGFAVSPFPSRSEAFDAKELSFDKLVGYYAANRDLIGTPGHYMGAWHDPASGKVFLDISVVSSNRSDAAKLAITHDQIAYFDIKAGSSVTVNAHATSGGAIH